MANIHEETSHVDPMVAKLVDFIEPQQQLGGQTQVQLDSAFGVLIHNNHANLMPLFFREDVLRKVRDMDGVTANHTLFTALYPETVRTVDSILPSGGYVRAFCSIIRIARSNRTLSVPRDRAHKKTTLGTIDLLKGPIEGNSDHDGYIAVVSDNFAPTADIAFKLRKYSGSLVDIDLHRELAKIK